MSMMPPSSADPADEEIAAAEPGHGAPPSAPGFGVHSGEPDVDEEAPDDQPGEAAAELPTSTPFRTPDPTAIGPDAES